MMYSLLLLPLAFMSTVVYALPKVDATTAPIHVRATTKKTFGCAQANVILIGLPPYHKIVTDGGWDPDFVYENMVNDSKNIANAGYNYMRLLFGPEQDVENILTTKLQEVEQCDVATIGFGVRGSNQTDVTVMMETILDTYRRLAPNATFAFSTSPSSTLDALQRYADTGNNCTATPGKDLGSQTYCNVPADCSSNLP